jgi:hypothetical protein
LLLSSSLKPFPFTVPFVSSRLHMQIARDIS